MRGGIWYIIIYRYIDISPIPYLLDRPSLQYYFNPYLNWIKLVFNRPWMVINNRVALCNIANSLIGSHLYNLFLIRLVVQRYENADPPIHRYWQEIQVIIFIFKLLVIKFQVPCRASRWMFNLLWIPEVMVLVNLRQCLLIPWPSQFHVSLFGKI